MDFAVHNHTLGIKCAAVRPLQSETVDHRCKIRFIWSINFQKCVNQSTPAVVFISPPLPPRAPGSSRSTPQVNCNMTPLASLSICMIMEYSQRSSDSICSTSSSSSTKLTCACITVVYGTVVAVSPFISESKCNYIFYMAVRW